MPLQTLGKPDIKGETVDELRQSVAFWMQQAFNHLDQFSGLRGTPKFYADVNANSKRVTGLGVPVGNTDAERVDFSLRSKTAGGMYDAQGRPIAHVLAATDLSDAVNLEQLRQEVSEALFAEAFVKSFAVAFVGATVVTILGATHQLATTDLSVTIWDTSSPRALIEAGSITVDGTTFDVVVSFAVAQSGRIVLMG